MRLTKKIISALLTAVLFFTFCSMGILAAPATTQITISPDADAKSAVVEINLPDYAKKDVSLLCLDPSYPYDETAGIGNWTDYQSSICDMRQITLDASGKAIATVKLREVKTGNYTISIGVGGASFEKQFSFDVSAKMSATANKAEYAINENIILTVVTPANITKLRTYNETNRRVGTVVTACVTSQDKTFKTWTVETFVSTKGENRSLTIQGYDSSNNLVGNTTVSFTIRPDVPAINKVTTSVAAALVNEPFRVFIETTTEVVNVTFTNSVGRGVGRTRVALVSRNGTRFWTFETQLGTRGLDRQININLVAADGTVINNASSFKISIV